MLIRNAKSFHDLQNKKILQAELLQLSIDNESVKEQRVSDYKNPNKPPPVPPQYRTTAEVQTDVMEQQKITIDNLRNLGLDYQIASQISQDMRGLREGDGAFLKFNKFFPSFKTTIEKNVNIKSVGVDGIIEEIKRYFDDIDSTMGLNLAGTKATTFFTNKPLTAVSILPSREDYEGIETDVNNIVTLYGLLPADVASLQALIAEIILNSPTMDELRDIDTFPSIERTKINRMIETLITKYHFPTSTFLYDAKNGIDATSFGKTQGQVRTALGALANSIKMINKVSIDKLKELKDKIIEEQVKIGSASLAMGAILTPLASASASTLIADNKNFIENRIKALKPVDAMQRFATLAVYGALVDDVPTTDGNAPEVDGSNWIYQIEYNLLGRKKTYIEDGAGNNLKKDFDAKTGQFNNGTVDINLKNYLQVGVSTEQPDGTFNGSKQPRYTTKKEFQQLVKDIELPYLFNKLHTDATYDPLHHDGVYDAVTNPATLDDRYVATQGFGLNKKKGGKIFKGRKPKKINDSDNDSDTDSDGNIHIDINSHNGKNYRMDGDGLAKSFMKRRIKIGKGIQVDKQEPTYKLFGKYVIHIPQLHNNVLNFRYKSLGPSTIRPVEVDDNFKEFMFDVLESGRVNDRHYKTLTEAERNHFLRAVKGAGIIDTLKLKNENFEKDKEEEERLELLLGEINAGNDNDNIIKEAKTIIKKYISNGKLSRQKGLDMLMHF
jgi:hypothetical protein